LGGEWVWWFGGDRGGFGGIQGVEGEEGEKGEIGFGEGREEEKGVEGERSEGRGVEGLEVLLSTLVHEVKNPLVAISTFAHLLPERYEDGEFREDFSRLVGLEVKRLNGVLEMLLDFGQMGVPQSAHLDICGWVRDFWEERKEVLGVKVTTQFMNPFPVVRMDEKHVNFIFERIADQIKSEAVGGKEIRVTNREMEGERKLAELEIWYTGHRDMKSTGAKTVGYQGDLNFEGLSLPLGLARRIMRRNNGSLKVLREEGAGTKILLRFQKHSLDQSKI
jgi:polar amino acid transport system substrate-binding protein